MATKQAEREFVKMAASLNWWCHKWEDVRYCPNCHSPIYMTKRDQAVEGESIVDYLVFMGWLPMWIECKGQPGDTRIAFKDITPKQIDFLVSFNGRKVLSALFITLGKRIPDRFAWLISIGAWNEAVIKAEANGAKSFNYKKDMDIFEPYKLVWENGQWKVSETHPLVTKYPFILSLPPLR